MPAASPAIAGTAATGADSPARHDGRGSVRIYVALIVLAVAVLGIGLSAVPLTDPDEVFYAGTAREMLAQHTFLTPIIFGKPQFEKPPLTYWLLMASFEAFGVHTWSARLVPLLAGLVAALAVFLLVRRFVNLEIAAAAALVQLTALACLGQSLALLTDMVFTALIAWSLYCFWRWWEDRRSGWLHLFAALAGLAVMTKGPVGIIAELLTVVLFLRIAGADQRLKRFLFHSWWAVFSLVAAPWYLWATAKFGRAFTWEFLVHDNWDRILRAEHTNFDHWFFYLAVVIVGMLPWTPLLAFLGAGWRKRREAMLFPLAWIVAVFVIFEIAHSKLPSYVLPLFPALVVLLALSLAEPEVAPSRRRVAAALSALFGIVFLALPFVFRTGPAAAFRPTILTAAAFGAAQLVAGALLLRRRTAPALAVVAAGFLATVFIAVTTVPPSALHGFSEADLPAFAARYGLQGQPIVSSKLFVRGAWFYTRDPVVVMDTRPHPFWSDHPLDVLWRDEQLRTFFAAHDKVLCTIRPGDLKRLDRLFAGERTNAVLSDAFDRVVVLSAKN
jgi:4-amino-4-deoxy-L-arabinose transferase-like glycosyltransferase